ncbi:MAG: hypothetical protein ACFFB5_05850 [Promethearchaeota archaeon]
MSTLATPDRNCIPYSKKKVYLVITIPLMIMILIIFGFLFFINPFFGIIFILFWLGANVFQSYCCEYQDCPYTDGFCPAVAGIIPASRIANLPIIKNMKKTKTRFDLFATFGSLCLLGLILFPLFFLLELGIIYPLGYIILILIYAILFLWNVCPVCAIRGTCPGGRFSTTLRELFSEK